MFVLLATTARKLKKVASSRIMCHEKQSVADIGGRKAKVCAEESHFNLIRPNNIKEHLEVCYVESNLMK